MTFVRGEGGEAAVVEHDDGVLISEKGKILSLIHI